MNVGVFKSEGFEPLPDYVAEDLTSVLDGMGIEYFLVDHSGLEKLTRADCDSLAFPYVRGNFSDAALNALIAFHAAGGSLLFLGDLPNRDAWYPLRNMQSSLLHLTRCADATTIDGLSNAGRRILGELHDLEFFKGREISALRITAFPPDIAHFLIHREHRDGQWAASPVVAVERFGEKFLGARFAQVAFNGGEPRENVGGGYQREWTYDPGMLTREWAGLAHLIRKLVEWLTPLQLAGAIDVTAVHGENEPAPVRVRLRNLTGTEQPLDEVRVIEKRSGQVLLQVTGVTLEPHTTTCLEPGLADLRPVGDAVSASPSPDEPATLRGQGDAGDCCRPLASQRVSRFGIYDYELQVTRAGQVSTLATFTERVFPADASTHTGFGSSTFWAFPSPHVTDEFKTFCREMLRRGSQYIRVNIPWEDVEPEPGVYDWSIPDQMIEFAKAEGFELFFWMFPTTRCSGLGDNGVPLWTLCEPAIDRDGNAGFFPSIWSPFYQSHYFAMLDTFTKRYADAKPLKRFIFDFGNSDFPYGYYYYVNDQTLFDYSEHERRALSRYLREERGFDLDDAGRIYGEVFVSWDDVPVPLAENKEAWRVYLQFREYSIIHGLDKADRIVRANAPDKVPPDPPGHGLGSIADLGSYYYDSKARHWLEERKFDPKYTEFTSAGKEWGGEAWQVGGTFREYDPALFQSVRLNATYNTIPGPDLGVHGDDIAKVGFIRRTIMGATRLPPEIGIIESGGWNDYQSLAHVGARLDQSIDLVSAKHRYDFSCYRLLVFPADEMLDRIVTGGRGAMLVPSDEGWYWLIRECIEKGLNILVFPRTCQVGRTRVPLTFLRQILELEDVTYGNWEQREIAFDDAWGGGSLTGCASEVRGDGEILLTDTVGKPVLVRRPMGKGAVLLAGYDRRFDSIDGEYCYERDERIAGHTLMRLLGFLDISPREIDTEQLQVYKEVVHRNGKDYALFFSHLPHTVEQTVRVRLPRPSLNAFDLATGELYAVTAEADGWYSLTLPIRPRQGRYLSLHDVAPAGLSS